MDTKDSSSMEKETDARDTKDAADTQPKVDFGDNDNDNDATLNNGRGMELFFVRAAVSIPASAHGTTPSASAEGTFDTQGGSEASRSMGFLALARSQELGGYALVWVPRDKLEASPRDLRVFTDVAVRTTRLFIPELRFINKLIAAMVSDSFSSLLSDNSRINELFFSTANGPAEGAAAEIDGMFADVKLPNPTVIRETPECIVAPIKDIYSIEIEDILTVRHAKGNAKKNNNNGPGSKGSDGKPNGKSNAYEDAKKNSRARKEGKQSNQSNNEEQESGDLVECCLPRIRIYLSEEACLPDFWVESYTWDYSIDTLKKGFLKDKSKPGFGDVSAAKTNEAILKLVNKVSNKTVTSKQIFVEVKKWMELIYFDTRRFKGKAANEYWEAKTIEIATQLSLNDQNNPNNQAPLANQHGTSRPNNNGNQPDIMDQTKWTILSTFGKVTSLARNSTSAVLHTKLAKPFVPNVVYNIVDGNNGNGSSQNGGESASSFLSRYNNTAPEDQQLLISVVPEDEDADENSVLYQRNNSSDDDRTGDFENMCLNFSRLNPDFRPCVPVKPLSVEEWLSFIDPVTGKILKSRESLIERIYSGGVEHDIRPEVWKYVFNIVDVNDTEEEKNLKLKTYRDEYLDIVESWSKVIDDYNNNNNSSSDSQEKDKIGTTKIVTSQGKIEDKPVEEEEEEEKEKEEGANASPISVNTATESETFENDNNEEGSDEGKKAMYNSSSRLEVVGGASPSDSNAAALGGAGDESLHSDVVSRLVERKNRIEKDVVRTDRSVAFFSATGYFAENGCVRTAKQEREKENEVANDDEDDDEKKKEGTSSVESSPPSLPSRPSATQIEPNWVDENVLASPEDLTGLVEKVPNLKVLRNILMTYTMGQFELGYVQGMNDLLSPILVVVQNEVVAYQCFVKFMRVMAKNFDRNQEGMHEQLRQLNLLVKFMDPHLYANLEASNSTNFFCCFRWLLIWFKREFEFSDIIRLWEAFWCSPDTNHLHIFVAFAVLNWKRQDIFKLKAFDEVLRFVNDLSGKMPLSDILMRAQDLFTIFKWRLQHIASDRFSVDLAGDGTIDSQRPLPPTGDEFVARSTNPRRRYDIAPDDPITGAFECNDEEILELISLLEKSPRFT